MPRRRQVFLRPVPAPLSLSLVAGEFPASAGRPQALAGKPPSSPDGRADAMAFLRRFPIPYPHYLDPAAKIARLFYGGRAWPSTAYYDRRGKLAYTHQGAYASRAKLDEDIGRHLLRG